jgi:hypothetical protein
MPQLDLSIVSFDSVFASSLLSFGVGGCMDGMEGYHGVY